MSDTLGLETSPVHSPARSPASSPARSPLASPPREDVLLVEAQPEPEAQPEELPEQEAPSTPVPLSTPTSAVPTRTVAIIKTHALDHRFDIEHRISEAGFEIVKERQMEFDIETDPDTMFELFGDDFVSFAEGPVWVYVLERRRAVEVWATLMGDPDPPVAREYTPHSLRALYGISADQNAVMGSPDAPTAEVQISAIFASSPPFPTTDLPDIGNGFSSIRSVSSSILSALRHAASSQSNYGSSTRSGDKTPNGKSPHKAGHIPAALAAPTIVPRMSRAAALRAGLPVEKAQRAPPSKERLAKTFENVPGHKRSETITVASTAPPAVAPRMTRAASLRLGQKPSESPRKSILPGANGDEAKKATFDGVPGHKRRESIAVASTKPPSIVPRTNRSASLRQNKEVVPPSSFMFKSGASGQGPSRSSSRVSQNPPSSSRPILSRPASAAASIQPAPPRPASRVRSQAPVTGATPRRPSSRPSTSAGVTSVPSAVKPSLVANGAATPVKPRPRPSSMQAPTITPRTNKSALLRAAKMATANAAAVPVPPVKAKAKAASALAPRAVKA